MAKKRNLKMWVVMAVFLVGMAPAIAAGGTIYVDADASTEGDGTTWGTAYKYLQDALHKPPTSGDEIWVAEGTYKADANSADPDGGGDRYATFQLINGVGIYGGFAGGETSLDERDWQTNETILSGDLDGDDGLNFANNGENGYHVVTAGSAADATAVLDGFTIKGGNADLWDPEGGGGEKEGGGMYINGSSPTVANCTFSGNSAGSKGGGLYTNDNSSPTLTDCTFSANYANSGAGMNNGRYCMSTLTNCTFNGNTAGGCGGGMYNDPFGSPTLTNCTFIGNSTGTNGDGGGISNDWATPLLTNCLFAGNSADSRGGGMYNVSYNPTLTNCTFSGNVANNSGGGIYNFQASSPALTNCIMWGNTGGEITGDTASVTYSCVQGGYAGTGNIDADPCFVDANGPDDIVGTEDDNLRLSAGSPCIDAGDNTAVPSGVTTDLDGKLRFVDDPDTVDTGTGAPPIVDMGAYEYYREPATIYVDGDATGANDGTSWANAYNYLQDGLADANLASGDEIWVAEGTYKPDANTANPGSGERTATFQLINGVGLYGGYAGYGATDPNERNWQTNETILSGDLDGNDVQVYDPCDLLTEPTRAENSYHVVIGSGTNNTAVLDGFTVTAGNASGSWPSPTALGGGMYNISGSPTVTNCTFIANAAESGSGMWNTSSSPTVTNCTFSGNLASQNGSGMFNWASSPTISNCTFSGNSANSGGGMLNNVGSSPTLTNCTFSGNSAGWGGGIYSADSSPTVTNCTFSGNSASSEGGGMYNLRGSTTVTNCILWGDSAPSGPEIFNINSTPSVTYSDIAGGYTGTGNIDEDPVFIDSNGLDGIGGTADDEDDNVHLRGYSPCINAGDPGGDYSGQVDVDNQPRVAYGRVDMGADEVFPIAGDFEPDGDVDFADFARFANHWLLGVGD